MKRLAVLFNLSLAASLVLSGCTVDAQLASSLLSSLQKKVTANTTADGKTTLTAKDLSAVADSAGVKVVCGGKDMSIASTTSSTTASTTDDQDTADATTLIKTADTIQPVLIGYSGPDGKVTRIQIDINLQNELNQLPKVQGAARTQRFQQIQQKYPQMKNAVPVPVKGGQGKGREVMFAQFAQGGSGQGGRFAQGGPQGGQMQYGQGGRFAQGGEPMQFGPGQGVPGGHFAPPQAGAKGVAAVPAMKGQPIQGYTNAQGQSCELLAKTTDSTATTAADTTAADTTTADTTTADTTTDTSAN